MRTLCVVALGLLGCGSSGDDEAPTPSFGERELASLDEACEGVPGLTGQAILDKRTDAFTATLSYVTASGDRVDPTELSVELTWPVTPVAVCYPQHQTTAPRVAIDGVGMRFVTADGKFDETLSGKALLPVLNGTPQFAQVIAATKRKSLAGSWQPFPEYAVTADTTMGFASRLEGAATASAGGTVSASTTSVAELEAGIFMGGFAMAIWP